MYVCVERCLVLELSNPHQSNLNAADQGHLEVVKALLEGGAKADVLDHDNWSPRQVSNRTFGICFKNSNLQFTALFGSTSMPNNRPKKQTVARSYNTFLINRTAAKYTR